VKTLSHPPAPAFSLFAAGFRPFFLLAGLDAIANMALWLTVYRHPEWWPASATAAIYWHAHEMLFGFAAAAIAGFLLTAVPNWTGRAAYRGPILYSLVGLWAMGRLVMLPVAFPAWLRGAIDLAFLPALALALAPPLIAQRKFRNLAFLLLLALLFLANLAFHLGTAGVLEMGEHIGLAIAIDLIVVMVAIIGGRVIPIFTRNGLFQAGIQVGLGGNRWIEYAAAVSLAAMIASDIATPLSALNGAVSLTAGIAQLVRLSQWHGHRTWRQPLLWVLHLGYTWLALGLILKAMSLLTASPASEKWIHALTVGCFATMILAIMSRASLGHSGRPLKQPAGMAAAYLMVSLAALVRVFAPALFPLAYDQIIYSAGGLWIAAFAIFVTIYAPILAGPRADGKPG
jgi:uncharacterized protein involved in response to NO